MQKQYRKVVILEQEEAATWSKYFQLYGNQADLFRQANVSRPTLTRVLSRKRGEERIIKAIRKYFKQQKQAA